MGSAIREIPIDTVVPHPENANWMNVDLLGKLRRHIEHTGRYEPLTVRPHPHARGKFEVLNGHSRLRVLRALGHKSARCVVWDVDDDQARLYLATLNRLSGGDIPARRAALLEGLLATFDVAELSTLLPDDRRQLEELQRLSRLEPEELAPFNEACRDESRVPVILNFLLDEAEAKEVNLALDVILRSQEEATSRSEALVGLARFYLTRCSPN